MPRIWLLMLGSNLDDDARIHAALAQLGKLGSARLASPIARLPADDRTGAPGYYNALVTLDTDLDRPAVVSHSKRIEQALGRGHDIQRVAIDIDLLAQHDGTHWIADPHALTKHEFSHAHTRELLRDAAIDVDTGAAGLPE